jgi:hypothetical protein
MAENTANVIQAVYDELSTNATLTALISTRIYSGLFPPNVNYPYVVLSNFEAESNDTKDIEGQNIYVQVNYFSRSGGLTEATDIKKAIYEALHRNTSLTMPSPTKLVDIRHDTLDVLNVLEDNETIEGVLRFVLNVE